MQTQQSQPYNKMPAEWMPPPSDPRQKSVQLPLSVSEWATLQAAFPLSEAAWKQMMAVLTAMKPALVAPPDPPRAESSVTGGFQPETPATMPNGSAPEGADGA